MREVPGEDRYKVEVKHTDAEDSERVEWINLVLMRCRMWRFVREEVDDGTHGEGKKSDD